MLPVSDWVLLALLAAFVAQDTTAGPQLLFSEPLVAGTVAGLLVGDVKLGLLIGTAIQLIWCGAVPAGTAFFLDINTGTVCVVALAGALGGGPMVAAAGIVWLIPVGLLGCALTETGMRFSGWMAETERLEKATERGLVLRHASGWAFAGLRGMATFSIGAAVGILVVPHVSRGLDGMADARVIWAGLFGAGSGAAVAATWRFSHGKAAGLGVLGAAGAWAAGVLPMQW